MGNNTSYMLGCADVSVRNSKHAYISREDFSAALRRNDSYTFFASQRQGKARDFADALERCHDTFMEGAPDDDGQLMHDGFIQIFGLRADEYTHRLVRIFDLDNSGAIGFREFVYGLSKFQTDTFERRVQFAYRLFDLDGDGSLDKHELTKAMRAALDADCAQYDLRPEQQTVKLPMRARVKPYNPTVMGKPSALQEEVERMARNMGKRTMGIDEFRLLVSRFPQIFQPPEVLYRLMHLYSRDAAKVISHLPPPQVKRLMEGLGRWQVDGSGATGFMDRSESGPKYRVSAGLGGGNDRSRFPLDTGAGAGASPSTSARAGPGLAANPPRTPAQPSETISTKHWACETCTLLNPAVARLCGACGMTRPDNLAEDSPLPSPSSSSPSSSTLRSFSPGHVTPRGVAPRLRRSASLGAGVDTPRFELGANSARRSRFTSSFRGLASTAKADASLTEFMLDLGLAAHVGALVRAEVLTLSDLSLMSDADMKEIGLPKGPRLRVLDALKNGGGGGARGRGAGVETRLCKVCMERPTQTVLKPCGHSLMCWQCASTVRACPVCRRNIEETIRWFPV